jgi:hypothetical protein
MIDGRKGRVTAFLLLAAALAGGYAAVRGVLDGAVYGDVVASGAITPFLMVGSRAQDYITIPAALALLVMTLVFLARPGYKLFIVMLGLAGYLFYGYGLYAIQGQYTLLYPAYVAVFGLALYGLIVGIGAFDQTAEVRLPKGLRYAAGAFLLAIPVILVPVWLIRMGADVAKRLPGETYGVFVLDLGIVFPALVIITVMLLRNRALGILLAGVALMKVLTVCLSVAVGEWYVAGWGGYPANYGNIAVFAALTAVSLLLGILYLVSLQAGEKKEA